ncbi:5'-3' exonuclease [Staphylococcus massiliensis]|uniref:5'-3' exonuclease n=1 Tax=Staphylococcus massiliensis S46 TaxID=1229783 RepID=K9AN58_9STAP|nr:5'-3' exonuclease [Staphylococcus massiliensis]EKU47481.1 putative 5'-3' exonuclease [Staphylococcus massiliensis S46]MCG3398876.1 5'-3' exonuclease [Staphylococcus massiliensis]MCG3401121.1 5'-3' exonuclease [Staphylococcus massiliensis]MCG3412256.1 5'-3' exonuclease [Staphylococcus massiliensis]POA01423.1 5'-3' exonuclease [Staphylococcus massiliensis CCUG 55927]
MEKRILLIDGMALLFRHFYATSIHKQFMRNSEGVPTNGTQGFIRHVIQAVHDIKPTHVAVCWDMGQKTFRNDMFEAYKSNRKAPPEELIPQFDHVKELSGALGFHNIGVVNYEADDVMGTIAKHYAKENRVFIVTGDRDLLQCIDEHVEIWLIKKGFKIYNRYDMSRFNTEYDLQPHQLVDVKAFMGDTADGYPGVKGIGEKTAVKLIQNHHSVEGVLDNIDQLTKGQQTKINTNVDALKLSKSLAQIHTDVPLDHESLIENMRYRLNLPLILNVCDEHELRVSKRYITSNFI